MRRGAFGALCLWLAALPASAADPIDWLQRIADAHSSQQYEGTVVVLRGDQLEALRVSHSAGPDAGTRLQSLTGEPRTIRRSGGFAELQAGSESMPRVGLPPLGSAASMSLRHYRVSPVGRDRVAGIASEVIEIRPRDVFRYGYRLWLDERHGLPLKSAAFGADGRLVEQWMFAEIRFDPDSGHDGSAADVPATQSMQAAPLRPADARWQVRDLPPGFELLAIVESSARGEHQLFGDGWARVSLYVEPMSTQQPGLSGLLQRGATNLFGRALDGRQITVVGEVPPITVERIAQGVVARDGS